MVAQRICGSLRSMHGRRVAAWTSVTLDGYTSGPDGPSHDTWLYEHVGSRIVIDRPGGEP